MIAAARPIAGIGIGYRPELKTVIQDSSLFHFVELVGDSLFDSAQRAMTLDDIGDRPRCCHFLNLSLASASSLDEAYVRNAANVISDVKPAFISDHFAITGHASLQLGHLSPPILDRRTITVAVDKIKTIQDRTGLQLLLENIASYFRLPWAEQSEAHALAEIAERADCGILLDVNNLFISATNLGFDPYGYLRSLPVGRVGQIHVAGAKYDGRQWIDTHGDPVVDDVFKLLAFVIAHAPDVPVMLERDKNFSDVGSVVSDLRGIQDIVSWQSGFRT